MKLTQEPFKEVSRGKGEGDNENVKNSDTPVDTQRRFNVYNRITIAQINIDSLRNKFNFLCEAVRGNIYMLLVTKTKLDSSFPSAQFHMHGYTTHYRLDRNATGGGLVLYVRENIPSKKINNVDFDTGLEPISIEINIWKT